MKFAPEQQMIIDCESDLVVIKSGAGTGKSTVLKGYARARPHVPMLLICYNESISAEAKKSFPENVKARTMHAIAFAITGKYLAHKLVGNIFLSDIKKLFENKIDWDIASHILKTLNKYLSSADKEISAKHIPVDRIRKNPNGNLAQSIVRHANELWAAAIDPVNTFPATHDIYLKQFCLSDFRFDQWFQTILFDEVQDSNPVVSDFVCRQKTKLVAVGDDHQQLYRWRGAENAMNDLIGRGGASVFYLDQSYRFGPKVAAVATAILDHTSAKTGCPPFPIKGNATISDHVYRTLPHEYFKKCHTKLHRTVSGTIKTALENINKRIYWVGGIEKYNLEEIVDVYYLSRKMYKEVKRKKLLFDYRNYQEYCAAAKASGDLEMARIIKMIDEHGGSLPRKIELLHKNATPYEKSAQLVVSTAHRSKGLEWPTVVLADDFPDIFSPRLKLDVDSINDELNLLYVASTRASHRLQVNDVVKQIVELYAPDIAQLISGAYKENRAYM